MPFLKATVEHLLITIKDILAKTYNGGNCIVNSYQTITVTNGAVVNLTVPDGAMSATITLERDTATTTGSMIRYTTDTTTPITGASGTTTHGIPITDFSTITILGNSNLTAFKAIAVTATNVYLRVQYFK